MQGELQNDKLLSNYIFAHRRLRSSVDSDCFVYLFGFNRPAKKAALMQAVQYTLLVASDGCCDNSASLKRQLLAFHDRIDCALPIHTFLRLEKRIIDRIATC
jgi:hypothetical protein